ncbi:anhydro-N-acetylmuramic acid kinase [Metaplanococcus flavidus]|uniref:Anhydro-N-acetylmuramic acid kinase n=1 Tax=Metaplanococcus flavidus TaxID=569883 RepID=A0ABW3L729_9BACL
MRVCGLMSGTSLDGLDIAVADFAESGGKISYQLVHFTTMSYPDELKAKLLQLMDPLAPMQQVSSMNMYLGEYYARLIREALEATDVDYESIDLISSHGQTMWHEPVIGGADPFARPNSFQIGDISALAEFSGKTVIGDFRPRDMAAGGQGAPLVPFADKILFQSETAGRILLNIGGIANMTVLPSVSSKKKTLAFDTGPGNMIIDAFASKHTGGKRNYDEDGKIAAAGRVDSEWLAQLLENPYYNLPAPKSTGRELFGTSYADELWQEADSRQMAEEDRIATMTKLTAETIAAEIRKFADSHDIDEVFVSGGGVHNGTLLGFLKERMPDNISVKASNEIGIDSDAKEAFVFALLGYLGFNRKPNNLPAATGAERPTILGKIAWQSKHWGE